MILVRTTSLYFRIKFNVNKNLIELYKKCDIILLEKFGANNNWRLQYGNNNSRFVMLLSLPKKQYSLHFITKVKKRWVYQLNIYFGKLNNSGSATSYVVINIAFFVPNFKRRVDIWMF